MEETIRGLLSRFWPTGALFIGGLVLIVYIALGFLYWQQGSQQGELEEQIANLSLVVSRPLPSVEQLNAEYEEVSTALALMSDSDAIAMLVGIAGASGIDINPAAGNFRVPPVTLSQVRVGIGTYQVLSFKSVRVQGDYASIMAFITDLDSGTTLPTMVLKSVATSNVPVMYVGEEAERRAEFRRVITAVTNMMNDNALTEIPRPMSFDDGVATNLMGDNPDTAGKVEGFPDITTTAVRKGYTGRTGSPRNGYVLYRHDRVSTDDTALYATVDYIDVLTTNYYYTCEADGTVRQFDGANVATATEYLGSEEFKIEIIATVTVDIYTKP